LRCTLALTWRTPVRRMISCSWTRSKLRSASLRHADVAEADGRSLRELRECLDSLELVFSSWVRTFQKRGGHLADGYPSAVSWLRHNCKMSSGSAADRVCVGKQVESSPEIAEAVASGELGYQSAAAVCHLLEQVGENRERIDEEALLASASQMAVKDVRDLCRRVRYVIDPDGAQREDNFNYDQRRLHISALANGMHVIDAILDPIGGAAVKRALESLAFNRARDERRPRQRMADALVELAHHALDSGALPAGKGVRPHVNVSTTLDGIKGVPGAATVDSIPISPKTLDRIACDCTISRVMLAGSVVIDVGRATRTVSPATRRALKARDQHCRWPGCDRPASWTTPHHIEFWSRGGPTKLPNLLSLCHHHHRLVHEGGWQVVRVGDGLRFIPPERTAPFVPPWRRGRSPDELAA
jgi:uncharacterized protein DUF222